MSTGIFPKEIKHICTERYSESREIPIQTIMSIDFDEDKRKLPTNRFSDIQRSYQPTHSLTKLQSHINTL